MVGRPRRVLKGPEHPHARGSLGDVPRKWISSPVTIPASTARCRRHTIAAAATTIVVARECVTGRWPVEPCPPGATAGKPGTAGR
jgi:hypothetical protein